MTRFGNNRVFRNADNLESISSQPASIKGVAKKTTLLLLITLVVAIISMSLVNQLNQLAYGIVMTGYIITPILTLVLSLIMSFRPTSAKVLSIPYAILEGLSVGAVCGILTLSLGNEGLTVIGLAFVITIAIFLGATFLYAAGVVKVSNFFRRVMYTLLIGVVVTTLGVLIIGIFNRGIIDMFWGYGTLSLVLSIVMVIIASLYSVISLDNANRIVQAGLDQNYEWYASFGIVLNVIWLFWEILRLVLILFSRNNN